MWLPNTNANASVVRTASAALKAVLANATVTLANAIAPANVVLRNRTKYC